MYCAKLYTFCKTGTHSVDFKVIKIILSPITKYTRLRPKVPITRQSISAMIREDMYEVSEHVFFQVKDLVTALYSAPFSPHKSFRKKRR